jgi:hypothetical protein
MKIKDTHPYIKAMEEIKGRVEVINVCFDGRTGLIGPPRVELAALQLRMVLELVALASLAANKELFEQQSLRFEKHWHPAEIMKDLDRINPRFFPVPFNADSPDDQGVRNHEPIAEGCLTREQLVEVHGRCGNVLHARNPFGKAIEYQSFMGDIMTWTNRVVALLSKHQIWLLGDEHFYVVHMTEENDDAVRMYTFERVSN